MLMIYGFQLFENYDNLLVMIMLPIIAVIYFWVGHLIVLCWKEFTVTKDFKPRYGNGPKITANGEVTFRRYSYPFVMTFKIDSYSRMTILKCNWHSFYLGWLENNFRESKSFSISNCKNLESIIIEGYCFVYFGGDFKLVNLPKLQSIEIGTIGSSSFSFVHCSFVIRGIELILNI